MKEKREKKAGWPGFRKIGVGGGLEEIWLQPGAIAWSGYGGAMYRIKVKKNGKNKWVNMCPKEKKDSH